MGALSGIDPTAMLQSMSLVAARVSPLLVVLGVFFGFILISRAGMLMVMGRDGRGVQDDVPIGAVITNIVIGGCLIQFARSISNTTGLLGGAGTEVRAAMQYMASGTGSGSTFYALALSVALIWVAAIGAVAVFRGLLLWREMGSGSNRNGGDDLFWRGLWHILGGGLCINIGGNL